MFNIKINLEEDMFKEIEKRLTDMKGHSVKIGMFAEQGTHKESGMSYVKLFKYLSDGDPSIRMPPRSPLHTVAGLVPFKSSPLKKDLARYLSNLKGKAPITVSDMLQNTGAFYRNEVRSVFGSPLLAAKAISTKIKSKSPNTPLIETGDLASKVAFKVDNQSPDEIGS